MDTVRSNLLLLMQQRRMSANRLAELSGVPQPTISRFLNGETYEMRASKLEKIAAVFGVTAEALRRKEGQEPSQNQQILSSEELGLLLSFRLLPPSDKAEVIEFARQKEMKVREVLDMHHLDKRLP